MKFNIVRAWKNELYRHSLNAEERALLPENPAGELELTDAELRFFYGGLHPTDNQPPPISYRADCSSLGGYCQSSYKSC